MLSIGCAGAYKVFGGIGQFVCFLMLMKLVFVELHWRDNKGLLLRVANLLFQKFEEFPY